MEPADRKNNLVPGPSNTDILSVTKRETTGDDPIEDGDHNVSTETSEDLMMCVSEGDDDGNLENDDDDDDDDYVASDGSDVSNDDTDTDSNIDGKEEHEGDEENQSVAREEDALKREAGGSDHLAESAREKTRQSERAQKHVPEGLKCKLCHKSFTWKQNLWAHMKRVHDGTAKIFKCQVCEWTTYHKARFVSHMNVKHTAQKAKDDDRIRKSTRARLYVSEGLHCELCSKQFTWKHNLASHMKNAHEGSAKPNPKQFKCERCEILFTRRTGLLEHMVRKHDNDFKESSIDETVDKSVSGVDGGPSLECDQCGNKYSSMQSLKIHKRLVHSVNDGAVCYICGLKLKSEANLRSHVQHIHEKINKKSYMCDKCGKSFVHKETFRGHMLNKHRASEMDDPKVKKSTHACRTCDKSYMTAKLLERHEQSHSGGFPCNICKKTFAYKFNLKTHIMQVHDKVFPYECQLCSKGFTKTQNLRKHNEQEHDGVPPEMFTCTVCGKVIKTSAGFKLHLERHKEASHECADCKKSFKTKGELRRHLVLHSGMGWRCKQCGEQFASRYSRNAHVNLKHKTGGVVSSAVAGRQEDESQVIIRNRTDAAEIAGTISKETKSNELVDLPIAGNPPVLQTEDAMPDEVTCGQEKTEGQIVDTMLRDSIIASSVPTTNQTELQFASNHMTSQL